MKWINKASEDKSTRICWVYNDKGCGSKKATCVMGYIFCWVLYCAG